MTGTNTCDINLDDSCAQLKKMTDVECFFESRDDASMFGHFSLASCCVRRRLLVVDLALLHSPALQCLSGQDLGVTRSVHEMSALGCRRHT
jgi:hypothetical protein